MSNRIKWGVIGSGGIARRRTIPEGISRARNGELSVVFDINAQVNTEVAKEFGAEEAENLRVRSELMLELSKLVKRRRLTQAKAATLLDVTQPRVSDLMRGKIHRFSVDSLIEMLGRAGVRVDFTTRRTRRVA